MGARTLRTPITTGTLILTTLTGVIRIITGRIITMVLPITTATTDWVFDLHSDSHAKPLILCSGLVARGVRMDTDFVML